MGRCMKNMKPDNDLTIPIFHMPVRLSLSLSLFCKGPGLCHVYVLVYIYIYIHTYVYIYRIHYTYTCTCTNFSTCISLSLSIFNPLDMYKYISTHTYLYKCRAIFKIEFDVSTYVEAQVLVHLFDWVNLRWLLWGYRLTNHSFLRGIKSMSIQVYVHLVVIS